jgi:nicotinamide-nucleotide amidase
MSSPQAWILTIGNEIINGVITDTNREVISRELRSAGISVKGMSSVGDDVELIAEELARAADSAEVTIVSGGLGPTEDDKSALGAAAYLGVPLRMDREQLARIEDRFKQWARPMAATNAKQAELPEGCTPLPNDFGTAPGFMIEKNGRLAFFFPGVPHELLGMFRGQGLPIIRERLGYSERKFVSKVFHVYGLSESKLAEILGDISHDEEGLHLAFLPHFPMMRLRLDSWGEDEDKVRNALEYRAAVIRERLPENIFSDCGLSMEEVVVELLKARGLKLAAAESLTGGLIGEMITRVSGSSQVFLGSVASYSNEMKMDALGVSPKVIGAHGAVSHECAREMALGVRRLTRAHVAVSTTGVAGPTGGTPRKPVGTFFIGLATSEGVVTRGFCLPGTREWVRRLSAMQALDMVRRVYLGYRLHGAKEGEPMRGKSSRS